MGKVLHEGLLALKARFPKVIGDVRGRGLMQALEFVNDETTKDRTPNAAFVTKLFEETKKRHLLIGRGGLYGNVTRIAPALNVTRAEIDEALRILGDSLAHIVEVP
jgi:alanine-glyoxylate transaminase/(R)-3-amino-2-methylpropionate-pyruvate transaminase